MKSPLTNQPPFSGVQYPDRDGDTFNDNPSKFTWVCNLALGLDAFFADRSDVFVGGNLYWYPVQGDNQTRLAPDVLVAFARPKGYRSSYLQWHENGVAPQVVLDVLSPEENSIEKRQARRKLYDQFGVRELYEYDPITLEFFAWKHTVSALAQYPIVNSFGVVSDLLTVRFELPPGEQVRVVRLDDRPF